MRLLPALAVLTIATAATVNAAVVNAPAAITVEGRACRGLEIGGLGSKFGYDLRLTSFEAGPFCSRSMVNITRLYVRDACLSLRDNNLGFQSYKEFTCPAATNVGGTTCANAFATAPPDSILNAATAAGTSNGATFDGDNVCANKDTGYIYVLNMCNEPVRLTFEVKTQPYAGPLCLRVLGKQLSPIAIMVCVAGALVALIVLGLLCCCCVRCCLR